VKYPPIVVESWFKINKFYQTFKKQGMEVTLDNAIFFDDAEMLMKVQGLTKKQLKNRQVLEVALSERLFEILQSLQRNWNFTRDDIPDHKKFINIALESTTGEKDPRWLELVNDFDLDKELVTEVATTFVKNFDIMDDISLTLDTLNKIWGITLRITPRITELTPKRWLDETPVSELARGLRYIDHKFVETHLDYILDLLQQTRLNNVDECEAFPTSLGLLTKILRQSLASRVLVIERQWIEQCTAPERPKQSGKKQSLKRKRYFFDVEEEVKSLERIMETDTKHTEAKCKSLEQRITILKSVLTSDLELLEERWTKLERLQKKWVDRCKALIIYHDLVPDGEVMSRLKETQEWTEQDLFSQREDKKNDIKERSCQLLSQIREEQLLVQHLRLRKNVPGVWSFELEDEAKLTLRVLERFKERLTRICKRKKRILKPVLSDSEDE
jgi:hypothetical protein